MVIQANPHSQCHSFNVFILNGRKSNQFKTDIDNISNINCTLASYPIHFCHKMKWANLRVNIQSSNQKRKRERERKEIYQTATMQAQCHLHFPLSHFIHSFSLSLSLAVDISNKNWWPIRIFMTCTAMATTQIDTVNICCIQVEHDGTYI